MRHLRRRLNYLERITLFDPTHMMSMVDSIAIGVEIPRINSEYSLEKEFTELFLYESLNSIIPNYQSC